MEANFENNEINEQIQYNPVIVVSNDINTILQSEVSNNILSQQIMSNDNADETTEYYELQPVQCTNEEDLMFDLLKDAFKNQKILINQVSYIKLQNFY